MESLEQLLNQVRTDCGDIGVEVYGGRTVLCYAVIDDLQDGYDLALTLPGGLHLESVDTAVPSVRRSASVALRGSDAFRRVELPKLSTFVYPEHALVPYEQSQFLEALIKHHSEIETIIVITTSQMIVNTMLDLSVRELRNQNARLRIDAFTREG